MVSKKKNYEVRCQFYVDSLRNKDYCQYLPQIYFNQKATQTPGSQGATGLGGLMVKPERRNSLPKGQAGLGILN